MGKQSSRPIFDGRDHKEICYRGNYHDKMYIGNQLVWEKLKQDEWNFAFEIDPGRSDYFDRIRIGGDIKVDWGDGSIKTYNTYNEHLGEYETGSIEHKYDINQKYTVKISGNLTAFSGRGIPGYTNILTRILTPFPNTMGALENFDIFFAYCDGLESLPENLFANCPKARTFVFVFYRCASLRRIPENLFANCKDADVFSAAFQECTSLQSIHEKAFAYCTKASAFTQTFQDCAALQSIPGGLFASCHEATMFANTFLGCTSLQEIPENLFAYCPRVTSFDAAFAGCTSLQEIPENLFAYCPRVTSFDAAFLKCTQLKGMAPPLWEMYPNASGEGCFRECTGLSNYDEIPKKWK